MSSQPLDPSVKSTQEVARAIRVIDLDQQAHSQNDVELLYRIYMNKRIDSQAAFYKSRIIENDKNANFAFAGGALVMTISSLIATISAGGGYPTLSVLAAILPAFAALLAAFRQLYGWERQTNIYRDALMGMERVRLLAPDDDRVVTNDLTKIYPQLVTSSETVFTGEVSQWGQFVVDKEKAEDTREGRSMSQLINDLQLNDEQRAAIYAVMSAGQKSELQATTNVTRQTDVTVSTEAPGGAGGGKVVATISQTATENTTAGVVASKDQQEFSSEQMAALAAAAASEVSGGESTTEMTPEQLAALAAAAASEVSDDDKPLDEGGVG
jgi:hypothetical protein